MEPERVCGLHDGECALAPSKTPGDVIAPCQQSVERESWAQLDCLVSAARCGEQVVDVVNWERLAQSFDEAKRMQPSALAPQPMSPRSSWSRAGGLKLTLVAAGGISALLAVLFALQGGEQRLGQAEPTPSVSRSVAEEELPATRQPVVKASAGMSKHETELKPPLDTSKPVEVRFHPRPSTKKSLPQSSLSAEAESSFEQGALKSPVTNASTRAKKPGASALGNTAPRFPRQGVLSAQEATEHQSGEKVTNRDLHQLGPTLSESLALLKRADKALKAGQSVEAKRLLARPVHPALVHRAESLSLIAECQLGAAGRVERLFSKYKRQFPRSPYLARLRKACGAFVP